MVGARSSAKVGAPDAGFHGIAPASDDVTKCAETKRTKDTEERLGWAVVTGAIAHTHPGEWLANLSLGHVSEEARVPGVESDKPDEAHVGTRGGLEPQNRVL